MTNERLEIIKQSPRQASVDDIEWMCEEIERLRAEVLWQIRYRLAPEPRCEQLTHGRNCPALAMRGDECTCGLEWRIKLQTEQTMHAAWRKRAEEAEAQLNAQKSIPHCPSCLCALGTCKDHPGAVFHPPATCPECASGAPAYALLEVVESEVHACEHLRSERLGTKSSLDGQPLFEMRKCLDCTKIFRKRLTVKSGGPRAPEVCGCPYGNCTCDDGSQRT